MTLALGKLERDVMEIAWQRGEVSVRDVRLALNEAIAYTTLMTTLNRLHRKGLLDRRKDGRAFYYSPRVSPEQFTGVIMRDLIDGFLARDDGSAEPVLSCIVDAVSDRDRALLNELDRLIRDKRRQLRRKG
jgi:predicted transcriptional regulator